MPKATKVKAVDVTTQQPEVAEAPIAGAQLAETVSCFEKKDRGTFAASGI